jgi:L-rhamnonate dehydratase
MKITDVQAINLRLLEIQQRTDSSQDALLVRVSTDAGVTGGEANGVLVRRLLPFEVYTPENL